MTRHTGKPQHRRTGTTAKQCRARTRARNNAVRRQQRGEAPRASTSCSIARSRDREQRTISRPAATAARHASLAGLGSPLHYPSRCGPSDRRKRRAVLAVAHPLALSRTWRIGGVVIMSCLLGGGGAPRSAVTSRSSRRRAWPAAGQCARACVCVRARGVLRRARGDGGCGAAPSR